MVLETFNVYIIVIFYNSFKYTKYIFKCQIDKFYQNSTQSTVLLIIILLL